MGFLSNPSALTQVIIVSLTCFCCPGIFNALASVAGGVEDSSLAFNGSAILYACFATSGLASAGLVNLIGPKYSLFFGTWGYVLYAGSLFYLQQTVEKSMDVAVYSSFAKILFYLACAILGVCAGLLWTAQGQMCMAYPTANSKGLYFSIFWVIFNFGGTVGGLINFGTNYDLKKSESNSSNEMYLTFLFIMAGGSFLSLFLAHPNNVVRNDGTKLQINLLPDWKNEGKEVLKLFVSPKLMLLFPLFAYSNWFYTYHTLYNVSLFNSRTSGLASAFYWGSQMLGALFTGWLLDLPGLKKKKALSSLTLLFILTTIMWGLGLWAQLSYSISTNIKYKIDFALNTKSFLPKFFLYVYYGFNDSICQVWSYWLMGQMSDDITMLGRYAGFYKAVQSSMNAVALAIGGDKVDALIQLIINWVIAILGFIGAYLSIYYYMDNYKDKFPDGFDDGNSSYKYNEIPMASTSIEEHKHFDNNVSYEGVASPQVLHQRSSNQLLHI